MGCAQRLNPEPPTVNLVRLPLEDDGLECEADTGLASSSCPATSLTIPRLAQLPRRARLRHDLHQPPPLYHRARCRQRHHPTRGELLDRPEFGERHRYRFSADFHRQRNRGCWAVWKLRRGHLFRIAGANSYHHLLAILWLAGGPGAWITSHVHAALQTTAALLDRCALRLPWRNTPIR